MLRMGKNPKDQPDSEHTNDNPANAPYGANRGYTANPGAEPHYRSAAETPSTPAQRAVTESESLARDIKEGTLSGFVGNGTMLSGEATFKGMLRVDGHLSGRVSSEGGTLIVGTNGQVDANIEVAVATIHGAINGDIIASQRLELGRAAKVNGNIQTPSLVIEQGAVFEGSCRMIQLKEALEKKREVRPPAGAPAAGSPSQTATSTPSQHATPSTSHAATTPSPQTATTPPKPGGTTPAQPGGTTPSQPGATNPSQHTATTPAQPGAANRASSPANPNVKTAST